MPATNRQLNWKDVTHGSTTLTGVTNVTIDPGGQIQEFSADDDRYTSLAVLVNSKPRVTIELADIAAAMGIAPGTAADLSATHQDAKKAAGGDIIYTLTGAVAQGATAQGAHGAVGSASLTFIGVSADGQTNPLSFTRDTP